MHGSLFFFAGSGNHELRGIRKKGLGNEKTRSGRALRVFGKQGSVTGGLELKVEFVLAGHIVICAFQ